MVRWITAITVIGLLLAARPPAAQAWDSQGHEIITELAIECLHDKLPAWVWESARAERLIYLSNEPDRWRGLHGKWLDHVNGPDHYFDLEDLREFDWSLATMPRQRYDFVFDIGAARQKSDHKDAKGKGLYKRLPGFANFRTMELSQQLSSSWSTLNTYEANRPLVTDGMIANARQNVILAMGLMSHYVGDMAQPLHTTIHYNGWKGDNPNGYTRNKKFHSFIDGGLIARHKITAADLKKRLRPVKALSKEELWPEFAKYMGRSFRMVEPLYRLEKSGELLQEPGKRFAEERLLDAAQTLAMYWLTCYELRVRDSFIDQHLRAQAAGRGPSTQWPPPPKRKEHAQRSKDADASPVKKAPQKP